MLWLLILVLWFLAGGIGYGVARANKKGKDSPDNKNHWAEYVKDEEAAEDDEEEPHHWAEYICDDDTKDRDDE